MPASAEFQQAVEINDLDVVEYLVNSTEWSFNPRIDTPPLHMCVKKGNMKICEFLVRNGASVNCRDTLDRTPLHIAVEIGDTKFVRFFILAGADLNARNAYGQTPIEFAKNIGRYKMKKFMEIFQS